MKKFLLKLSYTVLPLWLAIVGCVFYISLYVSPRMSGDIGHLVCIPFGHEYNEMLDRQTVKDTLFATIATTEGLRTVHADVLTIGDSFSQQKNCGYQNYIAQAGFTVANTERHLYSSPLQYAFNLLDRGIVDSTNIRFMVVENIEREFVQNILKFSPDVTELATALPQKTAVNWSAARARDFIMYRLGFSTPVYSATLDGDFFTYDDPRTLYFYREDITLGTAIPKDAEAKVVSAFTTLYEKAQRRGVKLIILVAVDKYDLYQSHIAGNTFPAKTVNEDLERILQHTDTPLPHVVMAKKCLLPLVERGVKDVFMVNDSHWSYKASEAVAHELCNTMLLDQVD